MDNPIQLNSEDCEDIEIYSNEESKATTEEAGIQTDRVKVIHIKAATTNRNTLPIQTDPLSFDESTEEQSESLTEDQVKSLNAFLDTATHTILKEMKQTADLTMIFSNMNKENYKPNEDIDLAFTLFPDSHEAHITSLSENEPGISSNPAMVSCVSWNCTGGCIAVGYCQKLHEEMCGHHSVVAVWSLFTKAFIGSKPTTVLDSPFHPKDPRLVVGGTYNGNVLMWDIQAEEPLLCISEIDEYFHREAVTQLLWVPVFSGMEVTATYNVVSMGTDGKILFWRQSDMLRHPIRGYLLAPKDKAKINPLSGTCLEFCHDTQSLLMGSISGALWKIGGGSIVSPVNPKKSAVVAVMKWKPEAAAIREHLLDSNAKREVTEKVERYCKDRGIKEVDYSHVFQAKVDPRILYACPSIFAYEFHSGPINAVKSSPYQRNLFVTASADGAIRLYDQQQKGYLFQLEPGVVSEVSGVDWSPLRPGAFVASCSNGEVVIYDFNCNKSGPVVRIGNPTKAPATTVKFNGKLTGYMAAGYENGSVRVYRLNRYYSIGTVNPDEYAVWKGIIEQDSKL